MNKSGTLITSALLSFGLATAAMAGHNMPKAAAAPMAGNDAATAPAADAPKHTKKHKKHKIPASATETTK